MLGRISVAKKNLFHEKMRLLMSVGGVTISVFLILILLALYRGWSETLSAYIYNVNADIWVMQNGSIDMSHSISLLPNAIQQQLEATEGVKRVHALVGNRIALQIDGHDVTTRMMGFDPSTGVGGPATLIKGRSDLQPGEIVIDEMVEREFDLALGDSIQIQDRSFRIVGIGSGGPMFQQSYLRMEEARELFHLQDLTNFFVVSLNDPKAVDATIEKFETTISGIDAQTTKEFATNNEKEIMDKFLPIILVLVVIGFAVGVVIISLTIYTATIEKSREYGVLKAIGASNGYLTRVVLTQSAIAGSAGFVIGSALTFWGSGLLKQVEPLFITLLKIQDVAWVAGITLMMVFVAAYLPLRRMMRIDPAIVFKA